MKCIVIGLGNFGSAIAMKLTRLGHEVIGVDSDINKVNVFKDSITYAVCLDSRSLESLSTLPVNEMDVAIVAIGEDFGASVMTTALLKQLRVKRLICRAISPLHEAVFHAIGVDKIIHPEQETAERLAFNLHTPEIADTFQVTNQSIVIKANVPERYIGTPVNMIDTKSYGIKLITVLGSVTRLGLLGNRTNLAEDLQEVYENRKFESSDMILVYGTYEKIRRFFED